MTLCQSPLKFYIPARMQERTEEGMRDFSKSMGDAVLTAEQAWRAADHLLSVTYPVVQDPKLLLHALEHLEKAARTTISTVLKREYLFKRIRLMSDGLRNKEIFFQVCARDYSVTPEDATLLREVLELGRRHRASGVEFSQRGKAVILDDEVGSVTIAAPKLQQISQAVRRLQLQLQERLRELP